MASSPTNIMLAIPSKKTITIDLYHPLRNYIVSTYSEHEAHTFESDLRTLKTMRNNVEKSLPIKPESCDILLSYFKALTSVELRFPISPAEDHVNSVMFTWYDAFKNKNKASQQNIHLEKAAVLFNLGSVYSQLGLACDRETVEGRCQAVQAFVAAAGVFAYLRDNEASKAGVGSSVTVDVSVECVGMLERLMLAQAQECVFENSVAKGSSNGVCAKISRQVGLYYEEVVAALKVAPLSEHLDKKWTSHIQLKAALFHAEACYRDSVELHEKEEIGEEIARLKMGITVLSDAKKSSSPKGAGQQILDAMKKVKAKLNSNLDKAMKENNRVYLSRVPHASSLPPLPAVSLVKSTNMNDVLDANKYEMFARLVPYSCAKAFSRYTEKVDDLISTQIEKLQRGIEHARVTLASMDLPGSIITLENHLKHLRKEATMNLHDGSNSLAETVKQPQDTDGKMLDSRPIGSALPTLDENEDAVFGALNENLRQLETLGAKRAGLKDMLTDMKKKDDILHKLMTCTGSYEELFREEITKYEHICGVISQNLQAQEQILMHIQAQYKQFLVIFSIEYKKLRGSKKESPDMVVQGSGVIGSGGGGSNGGSGVGRGALGGGNRGSGCGCGSGDRGGGGERGWCKLNNAIVVIGFGICLVFFLIKCCIFCKH